MTLEAMPRIPVPTVLATFTLITAYPTSYDETFYLDPGIRKRCTPEDILLPMVLDFEFRQPAGSHHDPNRGVCMSRLSGFHRLTWKRLSTGPLLPEDQVRSRKEILRPQTLPRRGGLHV
ncbi:hypothetical protein C0Q70_08435 [Pomacea canaliculata]|uniref:Uncharacterized protein n=1 Tax=Pomacea canaliculata TaxID=400727 RepID=A0A2T7PHV4_POMCA|nr:hypothetical protein C0Q70_08435 [Pomacea canaliculata]